MGAGLLLTIGKYLFVGLLYVFVIMVLRALIAQTAVQTPATRPRRRVAQPHQRPAAVRPVPPEPVSQPQGPRLVVMRTSAAGIASATSYPLGPSIGIGRKPHNDILLPDRYVSSTHALIFLREGHHILRDYHSTNGTLHNGIRIDGDVVLGNGDQITIGTTVFEYQA